MILSWAQEAVKRSTCIWNAFGHPPGNREGRGAVSETRADCFYTLFRELFLTLSHRCPTIVKILPAQLRLLKENVGGLALCGDAWKNNHVFLFISVMFSFKIVNTACHRYERLTLHPTPPHPRLSGWTLTYFFLLTLKIKWVWNN